MGDMSLETSLQDIEDVMRTNPEVDRRGFLAGIGALLATAVLPKTADAKQKHKYQLPPDAVILKYMSQPVEKTLPVGYTPVNDDNYQREVLEADRPVMVLFYGDSGIPNKKTPSRGLAALLRILADNFPEIKVCAYDRGSGDDIPMSEFKKLQEKYPLKDTPALLFYKRKENGTELLGQKSKGIVEIANLQRLIKKYTSLIPKYMIA